jgi:hypothetical protein
MWKTVVDANRHRTKGRASANLLLTRAAKVFVVLGFLVRRVGGNRVGIGERVVGPRVVLLRHPSRLVMMGATSRTRIRSETS